MTEEYKKVGRGGAGNFYPKDDIPSTDLESQANEAVDTELVKTISTQQPQPEYAHTGRGGAGNWVKPSELPPANTDPNSTTTAPTIPERNSSTAIGGGSSNANRYKAGRGGAGNFDWVAAEEERKREEERVRGVEEEGRRAVGREVESALAGLAQPGRVVVGDREGARRRGF